MTPFLMGDIANGLRPEILRSLIKPIRATTLRIFGKQIARIGALPLVAAATGPIPFGALFAVAGGLFTVYDIYQLQTDFESNVNVDLRAKLNQIRYTSMANAEQYASSRAKEIQEIQSMIASKASKILTNTQSK